MRTQSVLFPNFLFDTSLASPSYDRSTSLVEEDEKAYFIQLDIPGVRKENLSITFENGRLVVEGERKGRAPATIRRVFTVPEDVDQGAIEAQVQDGVLELALPKKEAARPKQIPIKEAKESFFARLAGRSEEDKPA